MTKKIICLILALATVGVAKSLAKQDVRTTVSNICCIPPCQPGIPCNVN